jgi:hypothetical protein
MRNFVLLCARWRAGSGWGLALVLGLLLASARPALAQVPTATNPYDVNPAAPQMTRPDTATVRKVSKKEKRAQAAADSAKRTERLFGFRVTRPQKAGYLAIIPGAGQIYNRKYWKLPIVYGMVGGLGYWVWFQQRYYGYYRDAKRDPSSIARIKDEDARKYIATLTPNNIENQLQGYRSFRDLAVLISALGYSLTILDAVVDAHLHDFDVSDNLSLNWQPGLVPVPGQAAFTPGLTLTLHHK